MADKKIRMQAPKGTTQANIEGHTYDVPKDGIIKVAQESHIGTLQRHGFTFAPDDPKDVRKQIDALDDKDELVEFIEERGGDADNSMGIKKLRRKAYEAAGISEDE